MDTTVSDPIGMMQKLIPHLLMLLDESGVDLPLNIPGIITGAFAGLLATLLPGRIPSAGGEPGAAVQAAILALRFFGAQPPTKPHITYEFEEAVPGRTYLQLAIDHVRDWSARKPVAA